MRQSNDSGEIAVIGAGTMGHGIAASFAVAGKSVRLFDIDTDELAAANSKVRDVVDTLKTHPDHWIDTSETRVILEDITYTENLPEAVSGVEFVFETVPERLEIKRDVFEEIEDGAPKDAIIATNTSSLSLDELGEAVGRKERFLGTHWFNPPYIVPVVEIVRSTFTATETITAMKTLLTSAGKTPVVLETPIPGFIGNRIQTAMANEAWALLEAGVASASDIDRAVKGTFGFRLPILGVFEKGDHSGLDVHHKVLEELLREIDRSTEPPGVLTELVEEGHHGVKTGRGVYDWSDTDRDSIERRRDRLLLSQLALYREATEESP